jgi:hypothetical protein
MTMRDWLVLYANATAVDSLRSNLALPAANTAAKLCLGTSIARASSTYPRINVPQSTAQHLRVASDLAARWRLQGYEFWSSAGFAGAWSDDCAPTTRGGGGGGGGGLTPAPPAEPVFEIVEPVGGGPGRIVRHPNQDAFEGLGGLRLEDPRPGREG